MFDKVVMLDLGSTDGSPSIARAEAPASWLLKSTYNSDGTLEDAVSKAEFSAPPESWRITLNPTEFLVHLDIRKALVEAGASGAQVSPDGAVLTHSLFFPSLHMHCAGKPVEASISPLLSCSSYLILSAENETMRSAMEAFDRRVFCFGGQCNESSAEPNLGGFVAHYTHPPSDFNGTKYQIKNLADVPFHSGGEEGSVTKKLHVVWHSVFSSQLRPY